jgi:dGTPase
MIIYRQQIEDREIASLAPYALPSRHSKGRLHPETEDPHRTAFQRDRDRILHTAAFRRLEYKTQVFVNFEGDYYRTRLTHTLEVAQIGRSLARALGANEDLVEALCLCHDLGHPPFGHSGEDALNTVMTKDGGFNHNFQTYRILTQIEERYPGWPGLNLSHEVREGILKHATKHDFSGEEGFDPSLRGSLEAQIADLSDSLAYNAHDLDDGLRAGLLQPGQLSGIALWQRAGAEVGWEGHKLTDMLRHQIIRRVVGISITDVIATTGERLSQLKPANSEALQRLPENVVTPSSAVMDMQADLKAFLYGNLYTHYRVVRMQQKAARILTALFEEYERVPEQLPPEVQKRIPDKGKPRTITDYLAGMTDRYALEEYQRLFEPFVRP